MFSLSPASAAFLVSLYVKDMWLGARRPDTLLTHIQMVQEAAVDIQVVEDSDMGIVELCRILQASALDP